MPEKTSGSPPRARKALAAAVVAVAFTLAAPLALSVSAQTEDAQGRWALTVPKRRAADAPPASSPPLPAAAESITPATINIIVRRSSKGGRPSALRQTVSRTTDRIHLTGRDGHEWLFERNPIDPRRVSATRVEHASKAIVLYEETDLRMALGIRGWADVLALGLDTELLTRCQRMAGVQVVAGIRFARYAANDKDCPAKDVLWNEELALPGRFTIKSDEGVMRFEVARVTPGTDASLLRPAIARFPTYRVFDLADWLEKH